MRQIPDHMFAVSEAMRWPKPAFPQYHSRAWTCPYPAFGSIIGTAADSVKGGRTVRRLPHDAGDEVTSLLTPLPCTPVDPMKTITSRIHLLLTDDVGHPTWLSTVAAITEHTSSVLAIDAPQVTSSVSILHSCVTGGCCGRRIVNLNDMLRRLTPGADRCLRSGENNR